MASQFSNYTSKHLVSHKKNKNKSKRFRLAKFGRKFLSTKAIKMLKGNFKKTKSTKILQKTENLP